MPKSPRDRKPAPGWLSEAMGMTREEPKNENAENREFDNAELERILAEEADDGATRRFVPPDVPAAPTEEAPEAEEVLKTELPKKKKKRTVKQSENHRPEKPVQVKWKGIPQLLVSAAWLLMVVVIGLALGRLAWAYCSDLMAFGKPDQEVTVQITEDDNISSIARKLGDADLVRYPGLFRMFSNMTKKSSRIAPGTYTLNSKYDYNALINAMVTKTARQEVEVTIPEGYNCSQIFATLEEKGVCSVGDLEKYAADGEIGDYWFLEGVTRGDRYCLEGYLFPDTYRFYVNDKPENVIAKMLKNFDTRFTDIMKERLEAINGTFTAMMQSHNCPQAYIDAHQLTIRDIVIMASIIEKETGGADESHRISSVLYNRLANPMAYPYLNVDSPLLYALNKKEKLTDIDKMTDNPYNTYTRSGLVPGPISSPGSYSLNAAMDPEETNFYYYAYNPATSRHQFSKTLEEHQAFLNK